MPNLTEPFGGYARYYDLFYEDKDYQAEVAQLDDLLAGLGVRPPARVLDLGCGTAGHGALLQDRGYAVTGVDRSEVMLQEARRKSSAIELVLGDVRDFRLDKTFDVAISMFAVLSYLTTNQDLLACLRSVRSHLVPGGLLVFDAWFGPAVLGQRPTTRVKTVTRDAVKVIRVAEPGLDLVRQVVDVHYTVLKLEGGRVLEELHEVHSMRFFFCQELELLLAAAGFERVSWFPFMEAGRQLSDTTWNIAVVARAR